MEFPACDGVIATGPGGEALCSGVWVASNQMVTLADLGTSDIAALLSAGLVTMCLAYGFRVLRRSLGF